MQVRLLGTLEVVRPDGTVVDAADWRTRKTTDLLRLLALQAGRPVRTEGLLRTLWPFATAERARGSLRTAASQIRRTVGVDCVARHPEGLVLVGAWVDVVEFRTHLKAMHAHARAGRGVEALRCADAAEGLWRGDFHASDDESDWAVSERERLRAARQRMLTEAARWALVLDQHREALAMSQAAVSLDPLSEGAHRSLMQAHAALGEVGSALRGYEEYRGRLAEQLGADPSSKTQALYLRILRGDLDGLTG